MLLIRSKVTEIVEPDDVAKAKSSKHSKASANSSNQDSCGSKTVAAKESKNNNTPNLEGSFNNLSLERPNHEKLLDNELELDEENAANSLGEAQGNDGQHSDLEEKQKENINKKKGELLVIQQSVDFQEDCYPLENEEWVVFLQRSIEEIINGEVASLSQPNLTNIVVSPLKNRNTSSKVVTYVASLLSLPFVVPGTSQDSLLQIQKVSVKINSDFEPMIKNAKFLEFVFLLWLCFLRSVIFYSGF